MRSPFIDIVVPEREVAWGRENEILRFTPFVEPEAVTSSQERGADAGLYYDEVAVDDADLKSLPVPEKNPVPFAPFPANGSYWPIITSHSRGREVAYTGTDKTIIGMSGRRFLAYRTDGGRYHVGIDLWANDKDPVVACEDGTIVAFYHFYRSTYALLVEHNNLVINYGEVHKDSLNANGLKIGDTVKAGQVIGMVGKMYSSSMLHFETYTKGTRANKRFMVGGTAPKEILNPTAYLLFLKNHGQQGAGSGTTSVPVSIPSGTTGLSKAIQLNRKYSIELGWERNVIEINDLLLKVTGQSGMSLGEEAFADAVAVFQRQQGLTGKNADGIIGPDTWRRMKPLLASGVTTVTPVTKPPVKSTSHDPEILSNLERYSSLIETVSKSYSIKPNVVRGIIAAESGGNPNSGKGRTGYKGLMQAYPDDISYNKKSDYHGNQLDPETSIKSGVAKFILFRDKVLKPWLTKLGVAIPPDEDVNFLKASLSCYNAGPVTAMKAIQFAHRAGDWRQWLEPSHYQRALVFSGGYARYEACSKGKNSYEIDAAKKEALSYRFKRTPDWRTQPDPAPWNDLMVAINPITRCWIETKYRNTPGYLDKFIKYYQYYESNPVIHEVTYQETGDYFNSSEFYETEMTNEYTMDEAEMVDEQEMPDTLTDETDVVDETEMDYEEDAVYENFPEDESYNESEPRNMESLDFHTDPHVNEDVAQEFEPPEETGEFGISYENLLVDGRDDLTVQDKENDDRDKELQYGFPETEQLIDEEAYDQQTTEITFNNEFDVAPAQGITDYLNTSAVEKRTLKTGVFIPASYKKEDKVDLVIYFHGLYDYGNKINGIEYYWKNYSNIRACFAESSRNAILLAPTLTSDPQQSSIVFGKANGFDNYVNECFKELKTRNYLTASAEPNHIILAGHSAGGSVLRRILGGKNQLLGKVTECWGFDCLYNYSWESLKTSVPFYHYWAFTGGGCISSPGIRGEKLQKTHGFQNIGPRQRFGHQGIIAYAWRNEINKRAWFNPVKSMLVPEVEEGESPFNYDIPPVTTGSGSGFQFKTVRLPLSDTPILLVPASDRHRLSEIREAPSVFLRKIVEMALGKDAAAKWFNNFTRITFLGRELQSNQYVHVELARHLKTVESELAARYGGVHADPGIAGDFLLGSENERLAGSRAVSATATYSFHMFGLAIDVNYTQSPFIQNKERKGYNAKTKKSFIKPNGVNTMNEVLAHACSLTGIDRAVFKYGLSYDQYSWLNKLLVSYLTLVDVVQVSKLSGLLAGTGSSDWKGITIEDARKKIQADLDKLALSVDRWGYRELFKKKGFLNITREFVNGVKLDWGGARYGDMMHFDMRNAGAGLKIKNAIDQYIVLKRKEAAVQYAGKTQEVTGDW